MKKVYNVYNSGVSATPQLHKPPAPAAQKSFNAIHVNSKHRSNMQSQIQPSNRKLDLDKINDESEDSGHQQAPNTHRHKSVKLPEMKLPQIADGKKSM